MIFVLDNYDSFTYNLVQAIGKMGLRVEDARNDAITPSDLLALNPTALILSPGPGRPEDACRPDQRRIDRAHTLDGVEADGEHPQQEHQEDPIARAA